MLHFSVSSRLRAGGVDGGAQMLEDRPGEIRLPGDIGVEAWIGGHGENIDSFRR